MNLTNLLVDRNLLYASQSHDKVFRKLRLREQLFMVQYYVTYPLTALDSTVIETLQFNGGVLNDLELAEILGFNVKNNIEQKKYFDPAEKEIFDEIIKEVEKFALISIHDHTITLLPLGYRAIEDGVKYEFMQGYKPLLDFFDLQYTENIHKTFPFYRSLGIETRISNSRTLGYTDFNNHEVLNTILNVSSPLIERFNLQSSSCPNIFMAEIADGIFVQEKRIREIEVDFRIYHLDKKVYPVVFYNNAQCNELNDILWNGKNELFLHEKRLQGLYHYTIRKTKLQLTLDVLQPYYKYWQISEIISNDRFVWSDEQLFKIVQEKCSGNDWVLISKNCPISDVERYLPLYPEMWDWTILSSRCGNSFISNNITLPWDFSVLSTERDIEFLKTLIVLPELQDKEWDWDVIIPKLDIPFIVDNLDILDIDLTQITESVLESYPQAILNYPNKEWNWEFISNSAPLPFILANIDNIGESLKLEDIFDRVFVDGTYTYQFCQSNEFSNLVQSKSVYNTFNANQKEYSWSITLIDWLEKHSLISWGSTTNSYGLECNPSIIWDEHLFEHYKEVQFTNEGFENISNTIDDTHVILNNIDFAWNWDVLSNRDIVKTDFQFIKLAHAKLNLHVLLPELTQEMISRLYEAGVLSSYMFDITLQTLITELLPRDIIIKHINDDWNWNVLTHRFCSVLNIENFAKPQWIDKWDWDYLSDNLDVEIIKDKILMFQDRWNWQILSRRLGHDFIIQNLPEYTSYWDWKYIINDVLVPADLMVTSYLPMIAVCLNTFENDLKNEYWEYVTSKISTTDAVELISAPHDRNLFCVNYSGIYNRRDFNIHEYLDRASSNKRVFIDWASLSRSKALNNILFWDKKVIKDYKVWVNGVLDLIQDEEYKWDFKYLSQLNNINWCDTILKRRIGDWDWDYICEHSTLFQSSKSLIKHIIDFEKYINFKILSGREELSISEKDFEKVAHLEWDWALLSKNKKVKIPITFMQSHEDYKWDWFEISSRAGFVVPFAYICEHDSWQWNWEKISANYQITFDIQSFLKLKDKDWDWDIISKRKEILFTSDVIKVLREKPLDWYNITKRDDFEISIMSISSIPSDKIAWDFISEKSDLSFDFIDKFKEQLDWKALTSTSSIDLSNNKYLEAFYDYLDWSYVSGSSLFVISRKNLEEYKFYLDWRQVTRRKDFDVDLIAGFEDYIDWSYFSRTTQIKLTPEFIEKYAERWDWIELSQNINFAEHNLHDYYRTKLNLAKFYEQIADRRREPSIYHFSHMFNAIEIIRSRKILSRNKAKDLGLLKYDAAGSVVNRTEKAHPYARFYFRTGTQTQFYNEFLGKQVGTKYYSKAEQNGVPMCPMPIFFKFDLQEVLTAYADKCHYSTGNLQSKAAMIKQVVKDPWSLAVGPLFSTNFTKEEQEKKQQEFLIPDEFDFSRLKNFQIICYDRTQLRMLEALFEGDPICQHFVSVESSFVEDVFLHENPHLHFVIDEQKMAISTNYRGPYHFMISGENLSQIKVGDRKNTIRQVGNEISFKDKVNIELPNSSLEIYYISDHPKARSKKWLIYKQ